MSRRRVRYKNTPAILPFFDALIESNARRRRRRKEGKSLPMPAEVDDDIVLVAIPEDLSTLIGGIDKDIQRIFLSLSSEKLGLVFRRYGEQYGVSKLIYAKNTYPHWKSGRTAMSGIVVARLLNLVPAVLDMKTRFELVKKIRQAYMRKERVQVACDSSNWFKKVPPVVDALIGYSNQFELPDKVVEKLDWLTDGDTLVARELLATAEVDEANARTKFLSLEYDRMGRMLSNLRGANQLNHTIELPQGTVEVTITKSTTNIFQRLPFGGECANARKRTLSVVCKNPACNAEIETTLSAYEGEPLLCSPGEVTCDHCGATHSYDEKDLSRIRKNLNVEIWKGLLGRYSIKYDCPNCSTRLTSPREDAGHSETCPKCRGEFVVPGK